MAKSNLVKSRYKAIFGGSGPKDSSHVEFAEHQRAGGTTGGQGYKAVKDVAEQTLVDEPSDSITYVGIADHGVLGSAASWQIFKVEVSGNVTLIQYADGDDNYDNVWDNRAALSYS